MMKLYRAISFALFVVLVAVPASAQIGGGISGLRIHNHSSAGQGGSTLSGVTLSGTTTNSGTISGGTVNATTLQRSGDDVVTRAAAETIAGAKTFDANLTVGTNTTARELVSNGPAGSIRILRFMTSGVGRWFIYGDSDAEAGTDSGTRLRIDRVNDAGNLNTPILLFQRSNGAAQVGNGPVGGFVGADIWNFAQRPRENNVPLVNETATQTLTNKTINGGTLSGTTTATGTLTSTKACAAGYTRIGPNYCFRTGAFSTSALTRDVCTTVASPSADALALVLSVYVQANAANAIALRTASVKATADDGLQCSSADSTGLWDTSAIEEVARTAGTQESINRGTQVVPTSAADNVYLLFSDDTGNQGAAGYRIMGYYD